MRIGVDLGGTKIEAVALDSDGEVLSRFRRATPRADYAGTVECVAAMVAELEAGFGPADSVGIGTPGASVQAQRGDTARVMQNCNSTWLNGRPLHADLDRACNRTLHLANDADCFALAEAAVGAGADCDVVFGVILGTGVGGGIVSHGRLHAGRNGLAGEWGHNPLPTLAGAPEAITARMAAMAPRACYCGRVDCVETWLSGPGFMTTCRASGVDAADLVTAMASGSRSARQALELYCWQLAASLAGVINLLDPGCIVLGGGVSNIDQIYTLVPEHWQDFVFSPAVTTPLRRAQHGDSAGVLGAAWLS